MHKPFSFAAIALAVSLAACQSCPPPAVHNPAPVVATAPATAAATRPAVHNFAKWEKDIAAFEAADRENPPPKDALLFVGSSTIVRWKTLQQDYPARPIINRGFGGNEIVDSTHFADRMIFPYQPRVIFFRAGGNDLSAGKTPGQVFADYQEFVATIHARLPDTDIVYLSVFPTVARWRIVDKERAFNSLVEVFCRGKPHLKYIDCSDLTLGPDGQPRPELFVDDKLHLSPAGYKLLIERVRPFVPQ